MIKVAILDDYQNVSHEFVDLKKLDSKYEVKVFGEPFKNEEEAIEPTIDSIPTGWCKDLEIMIVDGNSSDRTRELALKKGARVHLEERKGYGRAYRTGFDVAKNDIIVTMDADCTYPAEGYDCDGICIDDEDEPISLVYPIITLYPFSVFQSTKSSKYTYGFLLYLWFILNNLSNFKLKFSKNHDYQNYHIVDIKTLLDCLKDLQ